jgi:hypothetical protein
MKTIQIKEKTVVVAHVTYFELGSTPVETISRKRPKPRIDCLRIGLSGGGEVLVKGEDAKSFYTKISNAIKEL